MEVQFITGINHHCQGKNGNKFAHKADLFLHVPDAERIFQSVSNANLKD
jgi:hypothetical protein